MAPTPSPHPHPNINQPPPPPIPSTSICNDNTMDMAFLVKLRQSNKCGSVRNDEIINLHLGSGAALESASPASCKTPATSIDSICPNNQPGKKTKNPEMRSNSQQIVSYCLGLRTQNPGLREVDLEPSPKRGSDKIKMLKQGRKTQKKAS